MSILAAQLKFQELVSRIGMSGLNALFPSDFESYTMALELADFDGNTIDMFVFPIMPDSVSETQQFAETIRRSSGGITVITPSTFIPRQISISGSFGRQFKLLLGREIMTFRAMQFVAGNFQISNIPVPASFDPFVKTGYGCYKVLESIVNRAKDLDGSGYPYKLYLYNMALGNSYLVRPVSLTPSQSSDKSMIWKYSLALQAIAPVTMKLSSRPATIIKVASVAGANRSAGATNDLCKRALGPDAIKKYKEALKLKKTAFATTVSGKR